jgi:transcriptional regulator with XRE-family HTH domain
MSSRINLDALYAELDAKRRSERRSWRDVAGVLGVSPSIFTRLGQGRRPDVDTFAVLVDWLGVSADRFMGKKDKERQPEETLAVISSYLRADRNLRPESAEAIDTIMRTAYEQLIERDEQATR